MEIREYVEYLLQNYHEIKRNMNVLNFQIEKFTGMTYDEVIENMNFAKADGERVSNSKVSDKTAQIALIYREITDNRNFEELRDMVKRYYELKEEIELIEYCVASLEKRLSSIISDMFFNKLSWAELCGKYYISHAMVGKYRKKALLEISKMYQARLVLC